MITVARWLAANFIMTGVAYVVYRALGLLK